MRSWSCFPQWNASHKLPPRQESHRRLPEKAARSVARPVIAKESNAANDKASFPFIFPLLPPGPLADKTTEP